MNPAELQAMPVSEYYALRETMIMQGEQVQKQNDRAARQAKRQQMKAERQKLLTMGGGPPDSFKAGAWQ